MSASPLPWYAPLFVAVQAVLPTRLLSRLVHGLAHIRWRPLRRLLIRTFARAFSVDMRDAAQPDLDSYPHFNAFFTRALRDGARSLPADTQALCSPVDGTLSQFGSMEGHRLVQAKGRDYTADALLAEDASDFRGGAFCTIYLAPYNYHRIHAPHDLQLRGWRYVPGRLFSVNPSTAALRDQLFARNERVVAHFDCAGGRLAMVMVGALLVGSVDTVWAGRICPPHRRSASALMPGSGTFARGAELARFNMGSTVILLATPGLLQWHSDLRTGADVRMGATLGHLGQRTNLGPLSSKCPDDPKDA
ncbi:archaetidylserine decarboxylase [Algiphilus sp.]|uniref:archaetidylserine decarboxylase n=1 Tax=Algiphilus sp. TaxID=1872431 RepID=UPI0032EC25BD